MEGQKQYKDETRGWDDKGWRQKEKQENEGQTREGKWEVAG